jgi:hypothetical protein
LEYWVGVRRILSAAEEDEAEAEGIVKPAGGRVGEKDGILGEGEWGIKVDTYGFSYIVS